ncbi:peptide ABC transporter substrate-binding protein [Vallitalea okinawensis]|uniref:peptide ABC transporter substrate-binding protein n=1 Tax=Vallitalea okinawensis TaxID=2078660 RepID=UPI0013005CB3|nr:peptide ABC transporter substrate-binding protein [Vallitalea okinawensis]
MKYSNIIPKTLISVLILSFFLGTTYQANSKEADDEIIKLESGFENLTSLDYDNETLRILQSEPTTLDRSLSHDSTSNFILNNISEGLVSYDQDRKIVAGVADSYSLSADQLTYTFYLRKDAKWNDGSPVTAHDFVYSWQRLSEMSSNNESLLTAANIKNYKSILEGNATKEDLGVSAIDDYKLVVELEKPVPYFLSLLTSPNFAPIKEEMVITSGDRYGTDLSHIAYNGPYRIEKWYEGQYLLLTKNPHYWGSEFIDIENIKIIAPPLYGYDAFLKNELDTTTLFYNDFITAYFSGLSPIATKNDAIFYLKFNQNDDVLKNANVRKAIALGFDNSYIVNKTEIGHPANYYIPSGFFKDNDGNDFRQDNVEFLNYDKNLARKYWNKAQTELSIETYTLELLTFDNIISLNIADYIKDELENNLPGLIVNIVQQPFDVKLDLEKTGQYACSIGGWGMDYNDPLSYLEIFSSNSTSNDVNYSNPKYDTIIQTLLSSVTYNQGERWELFRLAEKQLLQEDAVIKPIYQAGTYYLVKPNIKNLIQEYGMNDSLKFVIIE